MGRADDHLDRWVKLGDIIAAEEVAQMIGLSHRNSVYLYRARYDDFPQPILTHGRCLLWLSGDVEAWVQSRRITAPNQGMEDSPSPGN